MMTDQAGKRAVMFGLMAGDTYFVLTEALREFARRQWWEAEDDPTSTAQSRTRWAACAENALGLIENAMSQAPDAEHAGAGAPAASRAAKRAEPGRLRQERAAWEKTARACVCPPGLCPRRDFRDHAGEADPPGGTVCADLDPDQPCYAAVVRGLRTRQQAGR